MTFISCVFRRIKSGPLRKNNCCNYFKPFPLLPSPHPLIGYGTDCNTHRGHRLEYRSWSASYLVSKRGGDMICTVIKDWKLVPLPAALAEAAQLRTSIINSGICTQNPFGEQDRYSIVSPCFLSDHTFQSSPSGFHHFSHPGWKSGTKKIACGAPLGAASHD